MMSKVRSEYDGFTLIEILIVVAVVAILASIAVPSYRDSIRKSCRNDGKAALLDVVALQEKFYFRNSSYSDNFTDIGYPDVVNEEFESPEGCYLISLESEIGDTDCGDGEDDEAPLRCFTVVATAQGDQENDSMCRRFELSSNGKKVAFNADGDDASATCW